MQIGNFIGDAVKGNSYNKYPSSIRDGILLHRAIDEFTDNHPAIKETVQLLKPHFRRYSAIVLDMFFDYLLASRFNQFSDISLKRFSRGFYWALIKNYSHLPIRIKRFVWHFICTGRLTKYKSLKGLHQSLDIMVMVGRVKIPVETIAIDYLTEHEEELWLVFYPFFNELQELCKGYTQAKDRTAYLNITINKRK